MDMNELTIGQAKELAALFGGQSVTKPACPLIGQKVIVRASAAGVHYGTLVSLDGDTVTLSNARRLWFWRVAGKKGISLSDVAEHGIADDSKICASVPLHIVLSACEVMPTTAKAQASIEGKNVYNP